jgi:hypothetical protein
MTQTRTPSLDTHDERPRRSHSGTLGWDTNKRLMAGHVRERGSDHVNVPTAPGAGHEEPVFPWSRADFRHHVLRLVREYVPAIMEELHTIVDLSDPDEIRRDIDACATRWQLEKPWITRTMHRTVRVWPRAPAMRASRQWGPCFLRMAGGTGVRGDAATYPSTEDSSRRPRARSQRPRCSTGGCGTTCCTKDTGPLRATQPVRPPPCRRPAAYA